LKFRIYNYKFAEIIIRAEYMNQRKNVEYKKRDCRSAPSSPMILIFKNSII